MPSTDGSGRMLSECGGGTPTESRPFRRSSGINTDLGVEGSPQSLRRRSSGLPSGLGAVGAAGRTKSLGFPLPGGVGSPREGASSDSLCGLLLERTGRGGAAARGAASVTAASRALLPDIHASGARQLPSGLDARLVAASIATACVGTWSAAAAGSGGGRRGQASLLLPQAFRPKPQRSHNFPGSQFSGYRNLGQLLSNTSGEREYGSGGSQPGGRGVHLQHYMLSAHPTGEDDGTGSLMSGSPKAYTHHPTEVPAHLGESSGDLDNSLLQDNIGGLGEGSEQGRHRRSSSAEVKRGQSPEPEDCLLSSMYHGSGRPSAHRPHRSSSSAGSSSGSRHSSICSTPRGGDETPFDHVHWDAAPPTGDPAHRNAVTPLKGDLPFGIGASDARLITRPDVTSPYGPQRCSVVGAAGTAAISGLDIINGLLSPWAVEPTSPGRHFPDTL